MWLKEKGELPIAVSITYEMRELNHMKQGIKELKYDSVADLYLWKLFVNWT